MQLPCAGQGRQPLPSRSDACVTSYWVLPDAGIGRIGSKAAFLPSSVLGENEGKCLSTASGGGQAFPIGGTLERKGKIAMICCCSLVFSDFNIHEWTLWSLWLIVAF